MYPVKNLLFRLINEQHNQGCGAILSPPIHWRIQGGQSGHAPSLSIIFSGQYSHIPLEAVCEHDKNITNTKYLSANSAHIAKKLSVSGTSPPDQGLCPGPCWGLSPQTPL